MVNIIRKKSYVTSLALVNEVLVDQTFQDLIVVMKQLNEIDVSWCNFGPKGMNSFIQNISINRKLQYVNLSWNKLEMDEEQIQNLCSFIKYNPSLIHMDLSNTGLKEDGLQLFAPALHRSRSLRAIHFCGNEITRDILSFYAEKTSGVLYGNLNQVSFDAN